MKEKLKLTLWIVAAVASGLAASELLCRGAAFRDLAGRLAGRGHLIAMANGKGIYETDIGPNEETTASDVIVAEKLRGASTNQPVDSARVDREVDLLKAQFRDEKRFRAALRASGLSASSLRESVATQLRGVDWCARQIAPAAVVSEPECRQFYDAHRDLFAQPVRFRAAHLFLAAHAETPPEVVEEKQIAIAALASRLDGGEPLAQLVAEASEDEASKPRGGDLGFFSESRMSPEFIAEIQKLHVGETSKPFRSHLGFHIAQLTDIKPARLLSFEEAHPEISLSIANERRANKVDQLAQDLGRPGR